MIPLNDSRPSAAPAVHADSLRIRSRGGFALVIAIVLMAFLLTLLLTLSSMTQIETRVFSTSTQTVTARQNALMALNIALGQLQKYAGPDQRTTARADMDPALVDSTSANGHWIGVYGNGAPVDYGQTPVSLAGDVTAHSDARGSQAVLLTWLVSGNEDVSFTPADDVDNDGHIRNAPHGWRFTPTSPVDLAQASVQPAADDSQVLLVAEHSAASAIDYVAAPLVAIPGDGQDGFVGRYAWWIGDEGAKANVTLPMAPTGELPEAFVLARRNAVELVNRGATNAFSPGGLIGANYDPQIGALDEVSHLSAMSILADDGAAMRETLKWRFHDLTASSYSVLSDTYAGGLKQDLSAILATGSTHPLDTETLFEPEGTTDRDRFGVPTWGALRAFARTTAPAGSLSPRLPTSTDTGIAPVMTCLYLGLQYAAPHGAYDGAPIRLAMFPVVILWNPYTVPLTANRYEVGIMQRYRGGFQLQVQDDTGQWSAKETVDFSRGAHQYGDGKSDSYVRFIVDSPIIPPGASLIFSLQGAESGVSYRAPEDGEPQNVLTHGLNAYGHVLLDFGVNQTVIGAGESDNFFRVSPAYWLPPLTEPNMSGGELYAYLGEVADYVRRGYITSDDNDKHWYQAVSQATPAQDGGTNLVSVGGKLRNEFLQMPAQLSFVTGPTSAIMIQRNFSKGMNSDDYPDVRWLAQGNPRALYATRINTNHSPSNLTARGGMDHRDPDFNAETSGLRASSGTGLDSSGGIVNATLFEFRPSDQPLLSLGQLQHANLSRLNDYPAYPIGNSLGDFHFLNRRGDLAKQLALGSDPSNQIGYYYDVSWLLNRALWDHYFVSTIPHQGTGTTTDTNGSPIPTPLPNPRLEKNANADDEVLRDANRAAAGLALRGGFNVNSTSEQAWRAVLGGCNQLSYNPVTGAASGTSLQSALSRFSKPTQNPPVDDTQAWAWQGFRQLSEEQIAQLAANIVTEIRARGPFVSLGDFINRRLVDNPQTAQDERFKGTIQAAIDSTHSGSAAVNDGSANAFGNAISNPFHCDPMPHYAGNDSDLELMRGYAGPDSADNAAGSLSAFAPQYLTQADVLSAIGANLSARSDTFRIRCFGEVMDPLSGVTIARAWCEAVVQRQVDYLDPANEPDDLPEDLNAINRAFGRKFKIVAFKWLSSSEI